MGQLQMDCECAPNSESGDKSLIFCKQKTFSNLAPGKIFGCYGTVNGVKLLSNKHCTNTHKKTFKNKKFQSSTGYEKDFR